MIILYQLKGQYLTLGLSKGNCMFRYKYFLFIFSAIISNSAFATTWLISGDFTSWQENLAISKGALRDNAYGSYTGNSISISALDRNAKVKYQTDFMNGVATVGGGQSILPYQYSNIPWLGLAVSVRYAIDISPKIGFSIGPILMARQVSLPKSADGTSATSGSDSNYGGILDLDMTLTDHWILGYELGAILIQDGGGTTTMMKLAAGYEF